MIDFRLNSDRDFALGATAQAVGIPVVQQSVATLLNTFEGEWFLDTSFGIPYVQKINDRTTRLAVVEEILRRKIDAIPGVVDAGPITIDKDRRTRKMNVSVPGIEVQV